MFRFYWQTQSCWCHTPNDITHTWAWWHHLHAACQLLHHIAASSIDEVWEYAVRRGVLKYVTWPCWLEGACWDPEPCTGPWSSPPASASPGEARSASPCRKTQKSNKAARQKMKEGCNWGFVSVAEHGGVHIVFKLASDYKSITDKWNLTAGTLWSRNSLRRFFNCFCCTTHIYLFQSLSNPKRDRLTNQLLFSYNNLYQSLKWLKSDKTMKAYIVNRHNWQNKRRLWIHPWAAAGGSASIAGPKN